MERTPELFRMNDEKGFGMADDRLEHIFAEAVALTDAAARSRFVQEACAGDPSLRGRIESLLAAHDAAGDFLPLPDGGNTAVGGETPGAIVGRYKLLEQIGEGGFGVVFMAEQCEPVQRKVALKIIKLGMDTKQVVARFEAERQALAMMDHPNIAKVLDGGLTSAARPYFVMDLIHGVPITSYSDRNGLSIQERLELFVPICHAVQHAHQKGIVHRDLKPTNVLVTMHDDKPVPKVIDFGVAKAIHGKLTDKTLFTEFRQLIGTPTYMSPEQAQMRGIDVDTRSDIYSLGVLLYELLTSTTPFDSKQLAAAAFDEMQRIIREVEPPTPSSRVSTLSAGTRTPMSGEHRGDPKRWAHSLRGDLDWIVMRCLEKDRSRRYGTAAALAADINRHLDDQTVEARPPTPFYRLKKFIRRNKFIVLAVSSVMIALTAGLALAAVALVHAIRQQEAATVQAARSNQVAKLLKDMLKGAGPTEARGRDSTMLREILDVTYARVQKELDNQPQVQAELLETIGNAYWDIEAHDKLEPVFQKALDQYRLALGPINGPAARAMASLGYLQVVHGKVELGRETTRQAVEMARAVGDKEILFTCLSCQGESLAWKGYSRDAFSVFREAIELGSELPGDDQVLVADDMTALAAGLNIFGERAAAESTAREALERHRKIVGPDHPSVASDLYVLSRCLKDQDKLGDAEEIARQCHETGRRIHRRNDPTFLANFVDVLMLRGKLPEALSLLEQEVKQSPSDSFCLGLLADCAARGAEWPVAIEALSRLVDLSPDDDVSALGLATALAGAQRWGDYDQHCHRFLNRVFDTHDLGRSERAAKAALIHPVSGSDFDRACNLADFAATGTGPPSLLPWLQLNKGLADYRRNQLGSALEWCGRIDGEAPPECRAAALFIQAACEARLERTEAARKSLDEGDDIVKRLRGLTLMPAEGSWRDWGIAHLLRREASRTIEGLSSTEQQ